MVGLMASAWVFSAALSQEQAPQEPAMRSSIRAGQGLFQQHCSTCHTDAPGPADGERRPPALTLLKQYAPERILEALTTGKMQPMAASLTPTQRQQISEWITGRPIGSADAGDVSKMSNRCTQNGPLVVSSLDAEWRGWSPEPTNSRHQNAKAAGITAADVPKLKVKWVFAAPNATEMYSQPTVAAGRIFVAADNTYVYSLNAKTGCVYWSARTDVGVRNAPVFAAIPGKPGAYGVFFGDRANNLYGLDAQTGRQLWKLKVEDHPRAQITGSPAVFEGKMFIGISSAETIIGGSPTYPCCSSRGSVVAVDIGTGKLLWKTYTIAQEPVSRGTNSIGTPLFGPAGASVWNAPTIDAKRRRLYVGTGNAYTLPAPDTSDAMLALDIDTGRIVWRHQEFSADAYINGCQATATPGGNCPIKLGPDWDFGGSSLILRHLKGRDLLIGAGKGGVAVAVDPDHPDQVVWRTVLHGGELPGPSGLIVFGGTADDQNVFYPLQKKGGGLIALRQSDGKVVWKANIDAGPQGQAAAASSIPGIVFTGGWDGILRGVAASTGEVVWSYNTQRVYPTINGVPGRGGSLGATGPVVSGGVVYLTSGYVGPAGGAPGNVLIALAPQ
jgi:polyvinyl alcohol dehydrogenase (cytochrome)